MQRRTTLNTALAVLAATAWPGASRPRPRTPPPHCGHRSGLRPARVRVFHGRYVPAQQPDERAGRSGGGYSSGPTAFGLAPQPGFHAGVRARPAAPACRALQLHRDARTGRLHQRHQGRHPAGHLFQAGAGNPGFDAGAPQNSKAEQVLNQVQGGKMVAPVRQNDVTDVIARIKKGEFKGADYVLFGVVSSIEFTDALSPLQGTTSATRQYPAAAGRLLPDQHQDHEIRAAFSAQGAGATPRFCRTGATSRRPTVPRS